MIAQRKTPRHRWREWETLFCGGSVRVIERDPTGIVLETWSIDPDTGDRRTNRVTLSQGEIDLINRTPIKARAAA